MAQTSPDDERQRHTDRLSTVGRVAASVAHELGTPLSVVRLHAQLLASGEVHRRDEVQRSAAGIVAECDRMTALLRRLLDVARPPRAAAPLPVDVVTVARETLLLLAPLAARGGVVLVPPEPLEGLRVIAPRGEVQQVVLNLVMNALQAQPDGGRVAVRAEAAGPRVVITVQDDGPGIAPSVRDTLFEPFVTTRAEADGTGLGLWVVQEVVQQLGGRISVTTGPEGTTFRVDLPQA